jgi:hemolysin activation/secretion protein
VKQAPIEFEGWGRWLWAAAVVSLWLCAPVAAQTPPAASPAAKVMVTAFKVSGNTLLPAARIDDALAPFKGERTAAELKLAALAVQELYARAGYGGVAAVLPEQTLAGGVVAITVVEGHIARVTTSGNKQFSNDNIVASVPALAVGATPPLKRIDAQIQLANENPAKQVEVLLQPGQKSGEIEANLAVREQPLQRWSVAADNTGTQQTGRLRASIGWQHANLWGRDHVLSAQYLTSPTKPSAVQVVSAGYRVPLYAWTSALDLYAAYSDIDGGNTATLAGDLRFNGRGRLFGARGTRYLERMGDVDQRLALGLDHRAYLNQCSIADFGNNACGPAGESVSVQPLSFEYAMQHSSLAAGSRLFASSASIHHNLQLGGGRSSDASFEAVRPGAKPRYTLLRLSASGSIEVSPRWLLQARLAGQHTPHALVPGEQFGIGGITSVRGYDEREVAGDGGVFTSVELLAPPWSNVGGLNNANLRLLAFADAGQVNNRRGTPCLNNDSRCTLASVGAGARFAAGDFAARLFVASARKAAARTEENDLRAHVAVSYGF